MSLSFKDKLALFGAKAQNSSQSNIPKNTPIKQPNNNKTQTQIANEAQNFNQINNVSKIENGNSQIQRKQNTGYLNNINPSNNNQATNQKEINKNGSLNNNKHPVIGSTFIEQKEKFKIYQYPKDVKFSQGDEAIVIIFVGQTGAGKSTFINAYLNYLVNIKSEDKIRYKIITEKTSGNQTQSQTAEINIYNIRSIKYPHKIFQLIDTPGVCDTNQKDEEFVKMYKEALDKVEKLNCITFVYNASDVRETDLQKKVVKNITNLFANNIYNNCLAGLTHANNEFQHDAIQLLQKMDVFKVVKKSGNDWYFPVNSICYFLSFKQGDRSTLMVEGGFYLSEDSFQKYTENVFKLKELMTAETKKNLKIKKEQKDLIETLETNLLNVLFVRIKELKDADNKLQTKIKEIEFKNKEIENIEKEINTAKENKTLIETNLKNQQEKYDAIKTKLRENNEKIMKIQSEINSVNSQIEACKKKQTDAEMEEKKILAKKADIDKNIKDLNDQISKVKTELNSKVSDKNLEEKKIKDLEESLRKKKNELSSIDKNLKDKEEMKKALNKEKQKLENSHKNYEDKINSEKKEEEKLKKQQEKEEKEKNRLIQESLKNIEKEKENYIKSLKETKEKYINILHEEKDKKIKELKDSKNEPVEYTTIELIDDPNNERNLTCTKCKLVCHKDCDCLWGIPLIRPVIFCHNIKDGICIVCKHSKDVHNRKITKYINVMRKRKKTREELNDIDNQIKNFIKKYEEKESKYENDFKKEINDYEISIKYKKNSEVRDLENKNQTNTFVNIKLKQKDIENAKNNLDSVALDLNNKTNQLLSTEEDIKTKKNEKDEKNKEIGKAMDDKSKLEEDLKKKQTLIEVNKQIIKQKEEKKNKISVEYENQKSSLRNTIQTVKNDIITKKNDLTLKEKELTKLKELNKNNDLLYEQTIIDESNMNLNAKNDFINTKSQALNRIRNDLTNTLMEEKRNLEALKKSKDDEANNTKEEMFRKLCIIKLLNNEMEKVTLNKETIRSLDEIIDNLSKKFLDDRPLFLEIIKEYKEIVQKLDNPKLNPNPLYQRFDINEEDFKDIRLKSK